MIWSLGQALKSVVIAKWSDINSEPSLKSTNLNFFVLVNPVPL